ncbi:MAG: hypothetical protein R3B40_08485 [Polyangiales bacterium]
MSASRELQLSVTLRPEDVRAGLLRTVLRQTRLARLWPIWLGLTAGMVVYAIQTAVMLGSVPTVLAVFALVLAGTGLGGLWLISRLGDRMFHALPSPAATWRFSLAGVVLASQGHETLLAWPELRYELREERALVHPTPTTFHVLPFAGLSASQRTDVVAWLEAHAKTVPQPKRPWLPPLVALTLGVLTALFLRTR